jgi:hypothetical protein
MCTLRKFPVGWDKIPASKSPPININISCSLTIVKVQKTFKLDNPYYCNTLVLKLNSEMKEVFITSSCYFVQLLINKQYHN